MYYGMMSLLHSYTVLVLDFRMRMMTEVTKGRSSKLRTVPGKARVASIHVCCHTVMLPATLSSILTSALGTGASSPPKCVWKGNCKCINCRTNIQWSASKQRGRTCDDGSRAMYQSSWLHDTYLCCINVLQLAERFIQLCIIL